MLAYAGFQVGHPLPGLALVALGLSAYVTHLRLPVPRHQGGKRVFHGTREELVSQIRGLQASDQEAERILVEADAFYGGLMLRLVFVELVLVFFALVAAVGLEGTGTANVLFGFCGLGVVGFLGLLALRTRVRWRHGHSDLHDGKLQLLVELLETLACEATGKISLEAYLANPRLQLSQMAGFGHLKESYLDDWLRLRTRLSDGTLIRLRALSWGGRTVRTRNKGKKVKHRVGPVRGHCQVSLHLEGEHPAPALESMPKPGGFSFNQVQAYSVNGSKVSAQVRYLTQPYPQLKHVVQPLLWLYAGRG